MKVDDAIKVFDSITGVADVLGLYPSAVSNWKVRYDGIVPEPYAYQLHVLSGGKLKVGVYRKHKGA